MRLDDVVQARSNHFTGRRLSTSESDTLRKVRQPRIPEWLIEIMSGHPLADSKISISEENDELGVGLEMKWLAPADQLTELFELQPGISAGPAGYIPVGECLEGTGNQIFLDLNSPDGAIVRISHDAVTHDGRLDESRIGVVARSLAAFLDHAEFY